MIKFAVIPARYAATRFPGKLMQVLGSKTVIRHVYENTLATGLFDAVWVVTDSDIILEEIQKYGGLAVKSKKDHESGSDRIAEAIENMAVDIIVNVQGDEPFVENETLKSLLDVFEKDAGNKIQVASLMHAILNQEEIDNPNNVKVVTDSNDTALYFSRSPIPFNRTADSAVTYYKHIGVYAFRKQALLNFTGWSPGRLESIEKLEQLRYLENGVSLKMVITHNSSIGIDTAEDLEKAKAYLREMEILKS